MGQVGCAVGQFFVNLILPMINKQNSNMTDLVSLLSNSVGKSGQGEKEKENKPEEPKLVEIRDFDTEVDDAVTVFCNWNEECPKTVLLSSGELLGEDGQVCYNFGCLVSYWSMDL